MSLVAIVTGASGGIGQREKFFLEGAGYKVYNFSRHNVDGGTNFIEADVTERDSVFSADEQVIKTEGKIDLLVNNAGFGIAGAIETTPFELVKKQMDVNFLGVVNCTQAVLPYMRAQKSGRIISTSSVASIYSIPLQSFDSCSKAAINAFTSALRNEVGEFNVTACAVMPGDIRTGFTANRIKVESGDYNKQQRSIGVMEKDEINGMSPDSVAKLVVKLAKKKRVAPLYTVGFKYKFLVFMSRFFSRAFCDKVVGGLYVK